MGTVAIGVVPEQNKGGAFIDDRKIDVLKYIAFENGGGMIKLNGEQLKNDQSLGLSKGDEL